MTKNRENTLVGNQKDNFTIKLAILGDISLNDRYNHLREKGVDAFSQVSEFLSGHDFVVGNLECLAEGAHGENLRKKPRLKTKLKTLEYLKDINLGLACLANNHVYDNLDDGFQTTIEFLDRKNIKHIGASTKGDETIPYIFERHGIKVALLNYVTQDTNLNIPVEATVKPNRFLVDQAVSDIKKLQGEVDRIIVYPHWGGRTEGYLLPDPALVPVAHTLIDAGADLIVGHHSHTLQPYEVYKGKYIFYSLGNFCFADICFEGKLIHLDQPRRSKSVILSVVISLTDMSLRANQIRNKNLKLQMVRGTSIRRAIVYLPWWIRIKSLWSMYLLYEKWVYNIICYLFLSGYNPIYQLLRLDTRKIYRYMFRLPPL